MTRRFRELVLVLLAAVTTASSALAAHPAAPFHVKSTLDGRTVVPNRIRWIARPQIPASHVTEVDWLIDGKLRWTESQPVPGDTRTLAAYAYGGAASLSAEGFLVTTWLTPGKHRFTVSVTDTNGRKAVDTVSARVLPAPQPPAGLVGAWTRVVTAQETQNAPPQYGGAPPVGTWKLVFDRVGAWELAPTGDGVVDQYDAEPGIIHVSAPIQMAPLTCTSALSCQGGVSRFGYHPIGGQDCNEAGPFGTYQWAVTGSTLTLTAINEGCPDRGDVWAGTWTRTTA
jgi:hypothetical protein